MNTFQQVKELIKAGHWVACKDRDGLWSVFMYVRPDGRLEGTTPEKDIETSLDSKGNMLGDYT